VYEAWGVTWEKRRSSVSKENDIIPQIFDSFGKYQRIYDLLVLENHDKADRVKASLSNYALTVDDVERIVT